MTTLQFSVDETVAEAARHKAQVEGKSLEGWLAELVMQHVTLQPAHEWAKHIVEASERLKGNSGGRPWTRDELYDE